ncbi:hypothetical protein V493_00780 [Pseudogymnoascus sp. VKM F-4281 (FW-2241)]|nr:hypothetical protein V493_00780 [Pseudogymnoascus sp. VKM F-4281 (FW-2241)]
MVIYAVEILQVKLTGKHIRRVQETQERGKMLVIVSGTYKLRDHLRALANNSNSPQVAFSEGHETIVRLLLNHASNFNAQGGFIGNALQAASKSGYETIIELLLNNGADINAYGGYLGNPEQAASFGEYEMVARLLLSKAADVSAQGTSATRYKQHRP